MILVTHGLISSITFKSSDKPRVKFEYYLGCVFGFFLFWTTTYTPHKPTQLQKKGKNRKPILLVRCNDKNKKLMKASFSNIAKSLKYIKKFVPW